MERDARGERRVPCDARVADGTIRGGLVGFLWAGFYGPGEYAALQASGSLAVCAASCAEGTARSPCCRSVAPRCGTAGCFAARSVSGGGESPAGSGERAA